LAFPDQDAIARSQIEEAQHTTVEEDEAACFETEKMDVKHLKRGREHDEDAEKAAKKTTTYEESFLSSPGQRVLPREH